MTSAYQYDNKALEADQNGVKLTSVVVSTDGNFAHKASISDGEKKKRTKLENRLIYLAVFLLLVVIALVIAVAVTNSKRDSAANTQEVCGTADCAQASARILEAMDLSVNPCEDFYMYACGTWKKKNVIPDDKSGQNVFGVLRDSVQVINKYLMEDTASYPNFESIVKTKDMYASCIDLERIEARNTTVAIPLLNEFGGWPVLGTNPGGNWVEGNFNLSQLLILLRKYNNRPLINMYVSSDVKASDNRIIYLDQPDFGLPGRSYYLEDSLKHMREAYVTLASSVAVLFGADPTSAKNEMIDMLMLEIEIANISMKAEDRRDSELLYNKMTIAEMKRNFTEPNSNANIKFDWFTYISGIMSLDGIEVPLNDSEPVVVRALPYFQKLLNVLQKYSKRVIANYAVWYIMLNRANNLDGRFRDLIETYNEKNILEHLDSRFREANSQYREVIYGTATSSARWKDCVEYTVSMFGMALGHMFVKETFDESAKAVALDMIGNIRNAFNELLNELDWMDEQTKVSARDKAKYIKEWIGYPDDILQEEKVNKIYENITINRTEYFQNVLSNLQQTAYSGLRNLREKYDKNVWTTPPSTVNAFYNSVLNNIMFPAGILQPPFYSKDQPKSLNYGGIGVVIGHEITHGFDDRGRQYDKDGNLKEWWAPNIITSFKEKAQCIVDQYGKFVVPEANLTVNGINTQGENIADNGGLKQSFRAYRRWVEKTGQEEPLLPGLNFTHNQLFFINFAQIWCNNVRKQNAINAISTGVHSPGQFRVIGTLQNSREFATAFNCKSGQMMNPVKKCSVW